MQGNVIASMDILESAEKQLPVAWTPRIRVLRFRPHKNTLFYELCYLFGFISWFDQDVSAALRIGGKEFSIAWLKLAASDLKVMLETATASTVYPGEMHTHEEAAEELLTLEFLCGAVDSMLGDFDKASAHFTAVLQNCTKSKHGDPWHEAYALYEMASLMIRTGETLKAREYLYKSGRKRGFLLKPQLDAKIFTALRSLAKDAPVQESSWKLASDELGAWVANVEEFGLAPMSLPDRSKMDTFRVPKGGVYVMKKNIALDQTLAWSWGVETSNIGFSVSFVETGNTLKEPVEPYMVAETGDVNEGFFAATRAGELIFSFDNSSSKFKDKNVFFSCT